MSGEKANGALIGVGVAACAVCCAGPVLAVLAAIGIGSGVGYALFGGSALVIGAALASFVVMRRHRRAVDEPVEVPVELIDVGRRS